MLVTSEPADAAHCVLSQILVLALMLSAVGVASWASSSCKAYDVEAPKRLLVQHAYLHEAGYVTDSMLIIGGSDAVDVCKVFDVANYQQRNSTYRDWQVCLALHTDNIALNPADFMIWPLMGGCTCRACTH